MSRLAEDLAQVPLFSDLNQRQLRKLAGGFTERSFGAGRTVVREGHMGGVGAILVQPFCELAAALGNRLDYLW